MTSVFSWQNSISPPLLHFVLQGQTYLLLQVSLDLLLLHSRGFPRASDGKESACKNKQNKRICLQCRRPGFNPWVGKITWRWAWQLTPVFLCGESPNREVWQATIHGLQRVKHNWATKHSIAPLWWKRLSFTLIQYKDTFLFLYFLPSWYENVL